MELEKKTIEEQVSPADQVEQIEPSEVSEEDLDKVAGGLLPAV
jgi:hypothetical protein